MSPSSRRAAGTAAAWLWLLAVVWAASACGTPSPPSAPGAPEPAPAPSPPPEGPVPTQPGKAEPPPELPAPDECVLNHETTPSRDTVPVAAPQAFVERQLYETLVRFDCTGRVRPALAQTWRPEDGGKVWVITLRPDAKYWDQAALTPQAIAASWAADSAAGPLVQAAGILAVAPAGEHDLKLTLATPRDSLPPALADRGLTLTRRAAGRAPVGTGRYRPAASGGNSSTLVPVDTGPHPVVRVLATRDLRDALDAGADLVVTDDPGTLDYAKPWRTMPSGSMHEPPSRPSPGEAAPAPFPPELHKPKALDWRTSRTTVPLATWQPGSSRSGRLRHAPSSASTLLLSANRFGLHASRPTCSRFQKCRSSPAKGRSSGLRM
jgi:Bacterial extracellular solute-binding proteins, family 5 Middle